ncbi:MAG TPA: hypothetical protein VFR37_07795 [Longimicrobium sp.]|nr:hypothetical protein [Longimicrobium sp.]
MPTFRTLAVALAAVCALAPLRAPTLAGQVATPTLQLGPPVPISRGAQVVASTVASDRVVTAFTMPAPNRQDDEPSAWVMASVGAVGGETPSFTAPVRLGASDNVHALAVAPVSFSRFVAVWRGDGNASRAVLFETDGTTSTVLGQATFDNNSARQLSILQLRPNAFAIVYEATDSESGSVVAWAMTGTVVDNGFRFGPRTRLSTFTTAGTAAGAVDGDRFLVAFNEWRGDMEMKVLVAEVVDGRVVFDRETVVPDLNPGQPALAVLGGGRFLLGYSLYDKPYGVRMGQVTDDSLEFSPTFSVPGTVEGEVRVHALSPREAAISYGGRYAPGQPSTGYLRVAAVDDHGSVAFGEQTTFDEEGPSAPTVLRLTPTRVVVAYAQAYTSAVVRMGRLPGTPVLATHADEVRTVPLDGGRFLVSWVDRGDISRPAAATGRVAGSEVDFGPAVQVTNVYSWMMSPALVSTGRFAVAYRSAGAGKVVDGDASGDVLRFGAEQTFEPSAVRGTSSASLGDGRVLLAWVSGTGDRSRVGVATGRLGANGVQVAEPLRVGDGRAMEAPVAAALSADRFVLAYVADDVARVRAGRVDGDAVQLGPETVFSQGAAEVRIAALSPGRFVIAFRDYGSADQGTARVGEVRGEEVALGAPIVFDADSTAPASVVPLGTDAFAVAYVAAPRAGAPVARLAAARVDGALAPRFGAAGAAAPGVVRSLDAMRLPDGRILVVYAAGDRAELAAAVLPSPSP